MDFAWNFEGKIDNVIEENCVVRCVSGIDTHIAQTLQIHGRVMACEFLCVDAVQYGSGACRHVSPCRFNGVVFV